MIFRVSLFLTAIIFGNVVFLSKFIAIGVKSSYARKIVPEIVTLQKPGYNSFH